MNAPSPAHDAEIGSLTVLRGMAALWVVLLHISPVMFVHGLLPEVESLKPIVLSGGYAVPLFFILSGYVLGLRYLHSLSSPSPRKVLRYLWLRVGRVYPLHLFTLLVVVAMVTRHGWPKDGAHTFDQLLANCFMVQAWGYDLQLSWNQASWSISSEWFAYLWFPILAMASPFIGRFAAWTLLGIACTASALVCAYVFQGSSLPFKGLAVVVPTFAGGCLLSMVCPPGNLRRSGLLAESLLVAIVALPFAIGTGFVLGVIYLLLFFVLIAVLVKNSRPNSRLWAFRPLVYLGDISYSLYMTHVIAISALMPLLTNQSVLAAPPALRAAALLAALAAIFLVASATYHLIERPSRRWSRQLIGKDSPRPANLASQGLSAMNQAAELPIHTIVKP